MSDTVIRIENLSKQYRLGLVGAGTLREDLNRWWHRVRGREDPYLKVTEINDRTKSAGTNNKGQLTNNQSQNDYVWALNDVNFEVKQGEVLGIIGRNGAGKSTLLKIVSRITAPTRGQVRIRGRTASLLEVGTGFHKELTGRENIHLNGAIMGMTKAEVTSKLDEIVAFSGCERYVDTPVKRYSSGMMVRLGFAVAAHLEPEILIVDEVLAVGDADFQKKCLGKMKDVAGHGRTVLFVSHNMGAVAQLCSRAVLIENGKIKLSGLPSEVVESYLKSDSVELGEWQNPSPPSNGLEFHTHWARVLSSNNQVTDTINYTDGFSVEISYNVLQSIQDSSVFFRLHDSQGNVLWTTWDTDTASLDGSIREPGRYMSKVTIPGSLVKPGQYTVTVGTLIKHFRAIEKYENVLQFQVSEVGYTLTPRVGVITPLFDWKVTKDD